jgi:hypothetical protein
MEARLLFEEPLDEMVFNLFLAEFPELSDVG